jgi:hypothetical protein
MGPISPMGPIKPIIISRYDDLILEITALEAIFLA